MAGRSRQLQKGTEAALTPKGNAIWEDFERTKLTDKSVSSLNTHIEHKFNVSLEQNELAVVTAYTNNGQRYVLPTDLEHRNETSDGESSAPSGAEISEGGSVVAKMKRVHRRRLPSAETGQFYAAHLVYRGRYRATMKSDAESDEGIARNRRKKVTRRDTDASDERSESVSIEEIDGNETDPNLIKVLQLLQEDSCYEQRSGEEGSSPVRDLSKKGRIKASTTDCLVTSYDNETLNNSSRSQNQPQKTIGSGSEEVNRRVRRNRKVVVADSDDSHSDVQHEEDNISNSSGSENANENDVQDTNVAVKTKLRRVVHSEVFFKLMQESRRGGAAGTSRTPDFIDEDESPVRTKQLRFNKQMQPVPSRDFMTNRVDTNLDEEWREPVAGPSREVVQWSPKTTRDRKTGASDSPCKSVARVVPFKTVAMQIPTSIRQLYSGRREVPSGAMFDGADFSLTEKGIRRSGQCGIDEVSLSPTVTQEWMTDSAVKWLQKGDRETTKRMLALRPPLALTDSRTVLASSDQAHSAHHCDRQMQVVRKSTEESDRNALRNMILRLDRFTGIEGGENDVSEVIEIIDPVLPTKVKNGQVLMKTMAIKADLGSDLHYPFDRFVWSPHFEWLADPKETFADECVVESDVVYTCWVTLNDEPFRAESRPLLMVDTIEAIAENQMPAVYAVRRERDKINKSVVYTGLTLWRTKTKNGDLLAVWSRLTGIAYVPPPVANILPLGRWCDYHVRQCSGMDYLVAWRAKLSNNQILRTRIVDGSAQVREELYVQPSILEQERKLTSEIFGEVYFDAKAARTILLSPFGKGNKSKIPVWISPELRRSKVFWQFVDFAKVEKNVFCDDLFGSRNVLYSRLAEAVLEDVVTIAEDLSQKTTEHSAQQQNDIPSAEVEGQQQRQETIGSSAQQENEKPSAEIKEEPQSQTAAQPVTSFRVTFIAHYISRKVL
ncbi:unnamed protein product [Toxocara canis]|uniref:Origin recognition complex subunit 1 n=1 Tax=Toxocara canis TaxID=6265 RepID=A0A183ULD7_TOXCA|nr:unnamed protein product [Toxocara canis]